MPRQKLTYGKCRMGKAINALADSSDHRWFDLLEYFYKSLKKP